MALEGLAPWVKPQPMTEGSGVRFRTRARTSVADSTLARSAHMQEVTDRSACLSRMDTSLFLSLGSPPSHALEKPTGEHPQGRADKEKERDRGSERWGALPGRLRADPSSFTKRSGCAQKLPALGPKLDQRPPRYFQAGQPRLNPASWREEAWP